MLHNPWYYGTINTPKKQSITPQQRDFIFGQPLFIGNATISYAKLPTGFGVLDINTNRGGKAAFDEINISYFGDENKRVLGVRVWDEKEETYKEDIREYDKQKSIVTIYPKGLYEKINPLYEDTHHKKNK